jgi:protein-S-isoprenylcysteine O-methyltransferase Ste14
MSAVVIALRIVSLLAFVGPMSLVATGRRGEPGTRDRRQGGERSPVLANLTAFIVFLVALFLRASRTSNPTALLLAAAGSLFAVAGGVVVMRSRRALGRAWSLVPKAGEGTGLITTGPYHLVRHPIYLGLASLALGQALAFGRWPAVVVVVLGIVPTFVWRARAEEQLLIGTFGERYADYRRRTRMIIPHIL